MAKTNSEWLCDGDVSYEYLKEIGVCTSEYIEKVIRLIMARFPNHYLYIGITHNPCGRWALNYSKELHPVYQRNEALNVTGVLLTERAHKDDYEKMFVICVRMKEPLIRMTEIETITIAKSISADRIINSTKGGNGLLQENAPFYFLYVCISETKPINS